MCDTAFVAGDRTRSRHPIFAKNSDRQRNEAQVVRAVARATHGEAAKVRCTYLTIPQVPVTHAVLLCQPFWMWGAEMGANEHGLVIGNEGLHSRGAAPEQEALTGMDLLRLALERAASARDAVKLITELLGRYGQGGNCGHLKTVHYHNGFLIADPNEAFVLETVGREWVVERAREIRTMSNIYSIGGDAADVSRGMAEVLCGYGWDRRGRPEYAQLIANPNREHIGQAGARRLRSGTLLREIEGAITVADVRAVLRDHGPATSWDRSWHPADSPHISLCMHAGAGEREGQTVGSLISDIRADRSIHWVTATSAPCLSIFKPVFVDSSIPEHGPAPSDRFDSETLWWRHEALHRAALERDLHAFLTEIAQERDALEAAFDREVEAVRNGGREADRQHVVNDCWRQASEMEACWWRRMKGLARIAHPVYEESWLQMSRRAGLEAAD